MDFAEKYTVTNTAAMIGQLIEKLNNLPAVDSFSPFIKQNRRTFAGSSFLNVRTCCISFSFMIVNEDYWKQCENITLGNFPFLCFYLL